MHQIPVHMADEETAQVWRLRETQSLVAWLKDGETKLLDLEAIIGWLDKQNGGPWWVLLRAAVAEYALETNSAELPVQHFLEWLAEWGREVRRRQTGLMLLTAHRAKGLEFDHVAVLDGGWDKVGKDEDRDAPRRLFYVAMTRARITLTLARMDGGRNGLLDALVGDPSTLCRDAPYAQDPPPELRWRFVRPTLGDIDLGFAGRYALKSPVHKAIAALEAGAPLMLRQGEGRLELEDVDGNTVGRMAKNFAIPPGTEFFSGSVVSIIARKREDSGATYQDQCRCDSWEVVVPELVFSPKP